MELEALQAKYGTLQDSERRVAAAQAAAREVRHSLETALAEHHGLDEVRITDKIDRGLRWKCEDETNPIGVCYYSFEDENCVVCGQPEERL